MDALAVIPAESTKLLEVNLTGNDAYFHEFEAQDGSVYTIKVTQAEYDSLALPNAGQPTDSNGTWKRSYAGPEYDTPDGKIHPGEFALRGDGKKSVCLDNGFVATIAHDLTAVDKVSAVEADAITELIKNL